MKKLVFLGLLASATTLGTHVSSAPISFFEASNDSEHNKWVEAYNHSKPAQQAIELVARIAENPDDIYCDGGRFGFPWGPLWGARGLPGGCSFTSKFDGTEWGIEFEGYTVLKAKDQYFAIHMSRDVKDEAPTLVYHDGSPLKLDTEDFQDWYGRIVDEVTKGKDYTDMSPLKSEEVDEFLSDFWYKPSGERNPDNDWGLLITGVTLNPSD